MACVFLFYSSSCHKKKHEELHIGNGSRTYCNLASRLCRERGTRLIIVSPLARVVNIIRVVHVRGEREVRHSMIYQRAHYDVCARSNIRERKEESRRNKYNAVYIVFVASRYIAVCSRNTDSCTEVMLIPTFLSFLVHV